MRRLHRFFGIWLFLFLFIIGLSGILLGWKKNSFGLILAETSTGKNTDTSMFLSLDSLISIATAYSAVTWPEESPKLDRIEVRPERGVVKISFKENYSGIQIDATTGEILKDEKRYSDLIEHIHDGTLIDKWLGLKCGAFKLFYTTMCGVGLLVFTTTGFWLWYGPKLIRNHHEE